MNDHLKALISYYNEIVTDDMHWSKMHCVVEDGNMDDGNIESSISSGLTCEEFVVCKFLLSIPYEIRCEIWENKGEN